MDSRLEQVLDECLRRISTEGASVEECLARYPEYAAEMEPHLRLAARMASALSQTPSAAARERARQRLDTEMRNLQAHDQARAARQPRWRLPSFRGSWRVAAASAAALVALVFAGTGLVAASGDSVPGSTLYPVKRAAEDVRLALAFSPVSKAQLRVSYAERRGEELTSLVEAGDTARIPAAQANLGKELDAIRSSLVSLRDQNAVAQLRDRLQDSSTAQLTRLQNALQKAPTPSQDVASTSFREASAAYGDTVEVAFTAAPVTYTYAQSGTIQLRVTDPPPPGVEKAIISVEQVEALLVAGHESRWVMLFVAPQSFDLLQVSNVQKLLGQVQVEPGTYTRLRFLVSHATAVVNGIEHTIKVPSDRLSFTRPFTVEEGKTTVVLLDFDGAKSLNALGQGQFTMTPVVQVLAHRAGSDSAIPMVTLPQKKATAEQQSPTPSRQEEKALAPSSVSTPTATRAPTQLEIEGPIQSLSQNELVVRGQPIQIQEGSVQQPDIEKDQQVVVVAQEQADGSLVAVQVKELPENDSRSRREMSAASSEEARRETVEVQGVIRAIEGNVWLVGDRRLHIGRDSQVNGTPAVGAKVAAKGVSRSDGGVDAQTVQVVPAQSEAEPARGNRDDPPSAATPTPQDGRPPQVRPTPSSNRRATPAPLHPVTPASKLVTPAPTRVDKPTPTPRPSGDDRGQSETPASNREERKGPPASVVPSEAEDNLPYPLLPRPQDRSNQGVGNR